MPSNMLYKTELLIHRISFNIGNVGEDEYY